MGVLPCHRKGCNNIMCDYYSNTYGYICYECYGELMGKCDVMSIQDFMDSNKNTELDPWKDYAKEMIEEEFKNRFNED